ncbi:hypothetical protein Catovirus_1_124 [Catovirus CTV1]|uniref:Uncharacterized protein n=1 Tax=Catovirus CTV1 TaxID=1977631 RepID=A0A1V0S8P0_9VIRU|nr:hypothetical protein Catovirus_1_124 [Catovirus CTV1]
MILNCRGESIEISDFEIDSCPLLKAYATNNHSDDKSTFYIPFEKSIVHNFLNYLHQADELVDFAKLNSICKYFGVNIVDKSDNKKQISNALSVLEIMDIQYWFRNKVKWGGELGFKFTDLIRVNSDKYFEFNDNVNLFGKTFNDEANFGYELLQIIYNKKIKEKELFDSENMVLRMIGEDIILFYNRYKDAS